MNQVSPDDTGNWTWNAGWPTWSFEAAFENLDAKRSDVFRELKPLPSGCKCWRRTPVRCG